MRDRLELPRLSKTERDRRWSVTREQMRTRGIDNLVLAGSWTDTGWPATMEGAVRSGHAASREVIGRIAELPLASPRTAVEA